MPTPSADLIREVFPGVPLREGLAEYETLLSIKRAREMLGFNPQHSWRDTIKTENQVR